MRGQGPDTWKKMMVLGNKEGTIKLKDLAHEMGIGEEETLVFLRQVFPVGGGAEVYYQEGECLIDIDAKSLQYLLPLSPAEWVEMQKVLSSQEEMTPVLASVKKKFLENGPMNALMEILTQLEDWDHSQLENQQVTLKALNQASENNFLVKLKTNDQKSYQLFPCKILHLEGELSLVAEDFHDHCLLIISLSQVTELEVIEKVISPKVTPFEIEEFITAIRMMNEKETRLILKIHDPQMTNLFPEYHFLGKPCMISNPNGDLIWAAYVEPCEALYEWLLNLGTKVEILDPLNFKQEYLIYCEEKLKKIA